MKQLVKKGSTGRSEYVFIPNNSLTTGAGLTGLTSSSPSLTAYYVRTRGTATSITLAGVTVAGSWTSGGFVEVDGTNMPGVYRVDIPDAAFVTGADKVIVIIKGATNAAPVVLEYELVDFDPEDAMRLGLLCLPNARSSSAFGMVVSDGVGNVFAPGTIDGVSFSSSAKLEITGAVWNADAFTYKTSGTFGQRLQILSHGTAQAGTSNTIQLSTGSSATDDYFNGYILHITAGNGTGQARVILDYDGATKTATVDRPWITNPASGSVYMILSGGSAKAVDLYPLIISSSTLTPDALAAIQAGLATAAALATVQADTDDIQTRLPASLTADGFIRAFIQGAGLEVLSSSCFSSSAVQRFADQVWNEQRSEHTLPGSYGRSFQVLHEGTAQGGGASTITLDTGASAQDNYYNHSLVAVLLGTGAGQARFIADTGYVGATRVATVTEPWITQPDATSVFVILPFSTISSMVPTQAGVAAAVWEELRANHTTPGTMGDGVRVGLDGISESSFQQGAITDSAIAPGAFTAAAAALDYLEAIADKFLDRDMGEGVDSGTATFRTPRQALAFLRNAWGPDGVGNIIVRKGDDVTESWRFTPGVSSSALPVISSDPQGP